MLSNLGLRSENVKEQEYDQIFERFDKNQDGVIQKSEVKDLVYALSNLKNPNSKIVEKPPEIIKSKKEHVKVDKSNTSLKQRTDS